MKRLFFKSIFTLAVCAICFATFLSGCFSNNNAVTYKVIFNTDGGSAISSQQVESGKTATKPADPVKEGYTFVCWTSESQDEFNFSTPITGDITLNAKWQQKVVPVVTFTVKFIIDGTEYASAKVESGKKVTKPTNPEKSGLTFKEWILSNGTAYNFENEVTADITLYPKWLTNFVVTFNSNGGSSVDSITVPDGSTVTQPTNPTKAGYTFAGWLLLNNSPYDFSKPVTSNFTLYAKWTKDDSGNPNPDNPNPDNPNPGNPDNPNPDNPNPGNPDNPNPDNPNPGNPDNPNPDNPNPGDTETAYYTVEFNSNGGSSVSPQYVEANKKATLPAAPTKEYYVFAGWYKESALTNEYSFNTVVTADITLYAKWTAGNVIVTFDSKGGSAVRSQEFTLGGKATSPHAPQKSGYVFGGWYKESECTTEYDFNAAVNSNITLYAKWETQSVESFIVTFDSKGGNQVSSQEVDKGAKVTRPVDPTKSGDTFVNWYLEENYTTVYDFDSAVNNNITLYAKWSSSSQSAEPTPTPAPSGNSAVIVPSIPNDAITLTVNKNEAVSETNFHTLQNAINKAATLDTKKVRVIDIADGEYKEKITINTPNLWLKGSALGANENLSATKNNKVVLWYDDYSEKVGNTDKSGSVTVNSGATDFVAMNITFKNYYNTHALYQESLAAAPGKQTQAVALTVNADRAGFYNCKMTSYHDTLLANTGKQLYYKCWIEGKTDYIFGQNCIAYFDSCNIWSIGSGANDNNGGYVVAQKPSSSAYYYVFNNCVFDGDSNVKDGSVALGRPWGGEMKMVVINSNISGKFSKVAHTAGTTSGQRYCTMSNVDPKAENMLEYNNTGAGAITQSLANTCTYLTASDVTEYTLRKVLTLNGFNVTGDRQVLITFGTDGNHTDYYNNSNSGISMTGNATINNNGADKAQVKNGNITFNLTAGTVITINGYPNYTSYTVAIGNGAAVTVTSTNYKYIAQDNETLTISTDASGGNYFVSISILYGN